MLVWWLGAVMDDIFVAAGACEVCLDDNNRGCMSSRYNWYVPRC